MQQFCTSKFTNQNSQTWLKNIDIGDQKFSTGEKQRIKNLFMEYEDVFRQNENDLGHCGLISYSIELIGEIPKRCGV